VSRPGDAADDRPHDLSNPAFWVAEWRAALARLAFPTGGAYAQRARWDRMAAGYGRGPAGEAKRAKELDDTIAEFRARGFLGEGVRVLDVGCGTGRWAIPFARAGAQVTALDFSPGMLQRLREEFPADLAARVEILEADWSDLDLAARGWEQRFDLAFAWMTPAVRDPDTFLKLHHASRRGCCYRGWSATRRDSLIAGLWESLKGTSMPPMCADIVLPFNLLYAMGIVPRIEFRPTGWEREEAVEEAARSLRDTFEGATDLPDAALAARVDEFLAPLAVDGRVMSRTTGRVGTMVWDVG
jgi:SAM-dependent methyltransferase